MKSANFNVRGIPEEVMLSLKNEADERRVSMNQLIIKILEEGVGYSRTIKKNIYHELDYLAGTWSEDQKKEFEKNTLFFEEIDEAIWS